MLKRSQVLMMILMLLLVTTAIVGSNRVLTARGAIANDQQQTLTIAGRERSYLLHLPPNYDKQTSLPLVIVLHGGGGSGKNAARMSQFSDKADQEGFIVAYPDGNGRLGNRLLTWNAGNCCGYGLDQNIDDVGFISALIDKLIKDHKVDKKRVYVTGISNGGMMSYRLGCELSDKIAAIAPVAGALNVTCTPTSPVSTIIFHGSDDQHVLYQGGKPKVKADYHQRVDNSVANAVSFWVKHNKCDATVKKEQQGSIVIESYNGGSDNSAVKLYTINGGGHAWPGGAKGSPFGDKPTDEISATDLMWEFFRQHPKK